MEEERVNHADSLRETFIQFLKFGIVGLSNTLIGYAIYAASLYLMRKAYVFIKYDIYLAQVISFILSVAWSFYWNNRMVFKQDENTQRNIFLALAKTYVAYAFTGLFLSEILLMLWVDILGINEFMAPLISLIITIPLNFLLQKFWAFRS